MQTVFLDLTAVRFEVALDGTLRVELADRCGLAAEAMLAFPFSHSREHVVLRDGGGAELGIIERLDDVLQPARALIESQLRRRYFLPRVQSILATSERFGSSVWDVETDRGPRQVTMKLMNESVTEVEPGRYIITDVENNRFEIHDLSLLDELSRARFYGQL